MLGTRRVLTVSHGQQLWGFEMTPERQASMNIVVDSFSDPFAALDRLASQEYDIALVDIRMPSMNGLQFAKAARKADQKVKIALLTEYSMEKKEADALLASLGVDAFLKKPVADHAFEELLNRTAPLVSPEQKR